MIIYKANNLLIYLMTVLSDSNLCVKNMCLHFRLCVQNRIIINCFVSTCSSCVILFHVYSGCRIPTRWALGRGLNHARCPYQSHNVLKPQSITINNGLISRHAGVYNLYTPNWCIPTSMSLARIILQTRKCTK